MEHYKMSASYMFLELCFYVMILCHWIACGWMGLGAWEMAVYPDLNWIKMVDSWVQWDDFSLWSRYLFCLVYSLEMLLGIVANHYTTAERGFVAVVQLVGTTVLAYVFGNIGLVVANANRVKNMRQEKMQNVIYQMQELRLPKPLFREVLRFYEFSFFRGYTFGE